MAAEAGVAVGLLELCKPRLLVLAEGAVGEPDIQQNHLAPKVGELDGHAGSIVDGEIRRYLADFDSRVDETRFSV